MEAGIITAIAAIITVMVTATVHISISSYRDGKRDQKVASIQGELQEHKRLNPYRAHGNEPTRSKET